MDSYYVTQPNAKRLAEQGYKGEFPQMVWCRHYITNKPYLTFWTTSVMNKACIPAPTHLAALEWLEKEKHVPYGKDLFDKWVASCTMPDSRGVWVYTSETLIHATTPDALISAILDHLEGVSRD